MDCILWPRCLLAVWKTAEPWRLEASLISILCYRVSGCLTICVSTEEAASTKQAVLAAALYFILIRGDVWDCCHEY